GDLRPPRLRGGDGEDLPRESDPQPRPGRGELRALRPGQRHRAVRRLPGPLSRLRPPRAPLGAGRLAVAPLARPLGADGRGPAAAGQALLSITFLANQAQLAVDATLRTLVRHFFTRRHMLEWETAASTERRLGTGLLDFFANMWLASTGALALALLVVLVRP